MEFNREYFKDKTALVTGAASGIGLALSEELLKSGAGKVVRGDINPEYLDEHAGRLQAEYIGKVKDIICDVTNEEQVRKTVEEAAEFFDGSFDLLFNNAGAGFLGGFEEMDNDDWKAAFDLNFYSALYGMRTVIPIMKKQGGGQIINIISGIAFAPMAFQSRYAATKAALNNLSLTLRYEYWDDNIKISSATPGTTATRIFKENEKIDAPGVNLPNDSASKILNGTVKNEKIILGSDGDAESAAHGFDPDEELSRGFDEYLLDVARKRRQGIVAF